MRIQFSSLIAASAVLCLSLLQTGCPETQCNCQLAVPDISADVIDDASREVRDDIRVPEPDAADVAGPDVSADTDQDLGAVGADGILEPPAVCGDGEVGGNEQCDLGDDNGPNSNCLINCALNPTQRVTLGGEFMGTYEDEPAVDGQTDSASAYVGSGSWATTPGDDTNGDGDDKFELLMDTSVDELAFIGPYTVDDIEEVFFATQRPADATGVINFYLQIYTEPDGDDDTASWYGYRLTGEPAYARNVEATVGEWNLWSTKDGPNQLSFFDYEKLNAFGVASGQPSLQELQASEEFDWSTVYQTGTQTSIDYGREAVKYLSIQVAEGASADFVGNIDYVGLLLKDGRGIIIDLEP